MITHARMQALALRVTRSTWLLVATAAALSSLRLLAVLRSAGGGGGVVAGSVQAWTTVLGAGAFGTLVVVPLAVTAMTSQWRHRTLTDTLLRAPQRGRLVLGTAVAAGLAAAALAAALLLASALVGLATGILATPPDAAALLLVGGGLLGSVLLAWAGVAVGCLVRHQAAAVTLALLWLLAAEPLVAASGLRAAAAWLPGALSSAMAGAAGQGAPPPPVAGAALAGFAAALTLLAVRRLRAADVA